MSPPEREWRLRASTTLAPASRAELSLAAPHTPETCKKGETGHATLAEQHPRRQQHHRQQHRTGSDIHVHRASWNTHTTTPANEPPCPTKPAAAAGSSARVARGGVSAVGAAVSGWTTCLPTAALWYWRRTSPACPSAQTRGSCTEVAWASRRREDGGRHPKRPEERRRRSAGHHPTAAPERRVTAASRPPGRRSSEDTTRPGRGGGAKTAAPPEEARRALTTRRRPPPHRSTGEARNRGELAART